MFGSNLKPQPLLEKAFSALGLETNLTLQDFADVAIKDIEVVAIKIPAVSKYIKAYLFLSKETIITDTYAILNFLGDDNDSLTITVTPSFAVLAMYTPAIKKLSRNGNISVNGNISGANVQIGGTQTLGSLTISGGNHPIGKVEMEPRKLYYHQVVGY